MMYKPETIRRAADLLDAVNDDGNPVIEVRFNDSLGQVEIWDMLADRERVIASVLYPAEQREATTEAPGEVAKTGNYIGFGGSLIPTVLEGIAKIMQESVNVLDLEFLFDSEQEELHIENLSTGEIRSIPY